ncbi:hypothetical protein N7474_010695 [Penicillium riverlandense]|uniref:uncharacterized protein n=1 Tax=Penicillium riverlandense TaxID=1903569 RepID=UPI002547841D|nr:uncharacterized protein N7474_010695 [Penicillium riverlandense]KAJ5807103.1 hypothetical protein N7474_010695 [Penicillium riverlandense]
MSEPGTSAWATQSEGLPYYIEELSRPQGSGYVVDPMLRSEHTHADVAGAIPIGAVSGRGNLARIQQDSPAKSFHRLLHGIEGPLDHAGRGADLKLSTSAGKSGTANERARKRPTILFPGIVQTEVGFKRAKLERISNAALLHLSECNAPAPHRFPGFRLGSKFDTVVADSAGNAISIVAGDQCLVSRVRDEIGDTEAVFPLGSGSVTGHGPWAPSLVDVDHAPLIRRADTRLFITIGSSWDRTIHVLASQFDKFSLCGRADDSDIAGRVGVGEVLACNATTALSKPHSLAVIRHSALDTAVAVPFLDVGVRWVTLPYALVP